MGAIFYIEKVNMFSIHFRFETFNLEVVNDHF